MFQFSFLKKNPIIFTEADLDRDGKYLNAAENFILWN